MKIPILNTDTIEQLRGFFHPKDRSVILADDTFIEGEEVTTPANPRHNRGRLYWKNSCWTQLDESGNESTLCHSDWQTWTPTVTQSVAVTVTVNFARYVVIGNTVHVWAHLTTTSAGTGGNAISIGGIPAAAQPANALSSTIGSARITDVSAGTNYTGVLAVNGVADWRVIAHALTNWVGVTPNFALANGDVITFQATYERA